jgi:type IV pilus assembly protein PilE
MVRGHNEGVTLIELMIVVVCVGILAAVAIPAYNDYITRSRRSDAFTALETVRAAQEMYRAEKGFYSGAFVDAGVNVLAGCSTNMGGSNYTIAVARLTTTTFTAIATPQSKQAGDFFFGTGQDGGQYNCKGASCTLANLSTTIGPPLNPTGGWEQKTWDSLR